MVALIAATVTLVGYLWNARLQRQADARRVEGEQNLERLRSNQKAMVFKAILRSELKSISETMEGEIEFIEEGKFPSTWVPTFFSFKLVRENLVELGILEPDQVESVLDAFYTYQEHRWYIMVNGGGAPQPSLETPVLYDLQDPLKREFLLNDLRAIIGAAKAAVRSLDVRRPMLGA